MLQPLRRRTWAPCGQTPIEKVSERRNRLSAIGAILGSPGLHRFHFHFQLLLENVSGETLVEFLTAMHRYVGHHIIVIWDGVSAHRSTAQWFETNHPAWFSFEQLPAYTPELNPVEQCWNHTKHDDLANYAPENIDDLRIRVVDSMSKQQDNQKLLRSHFQFAGLNLD